MVDGAVPEDREGRVVPENVSWIESGFVPIECVTDAALGQELDEFLLGNDGEPLGDEMMRIPELTGALVGDAGKSAAAGRAPVGGKNGFPDDQNAKVAIAVALKDLLDCGGPPQTFGSSGREEKDEARDGGVGVEGGGEVGEI